MKCTGAYRNCIHFGRGTGAMMSNSSISNCSPWMDPRRGAGPEPTVLVALLYRSLSCHASTGGQLAT